MKKSPYFITAVASIALSGCGALTNVNDVNTMRTTSPQGGTSFTQALASEYRLQAIDEADHEVEWDDAAFFARKGLHAARGEELLPSDVSAAPAGDSGRYHHLGQIIPVPPERVGELSAARQRLMGFLDFGGRDRQPAFAAHAQAIYDCWIEEEWERDADVECRTEFMRIETQFKVIQTETKNKGGTMGAKANTFEVFFDFDRSNISPTAAQILHDTASRAKQNKVTGIDLTGHTDASGSEAYNQALSERRADAVKAALIKEGIPAMEITSSGVGKAGQLVPTADGVREPQNRRTEILLK